MLRSVTVPQSPQEHAEPTSIFYTNEQSLSTPCSPLPTELRYPECHSPSGPQHGVGGARPEQPAPGATSAPVVAGVTSNLLQVNANNSSPWQMRGGVTQPPDIPQDEDLQVTQV